MSFETGAAAAPPQRFAIKSPTKSAARSARTALLVIALAATAVIAPMFFLGNVSGHDAAFHIGSWLDVAGQWRQGIVYPRWAEWANGGFGEPRFIFYPPASWTLGAALISVLPHAMAPGAFIWLTLLLGGFGMWRLARESLPESQAAAAAAIFVANPYQLVVVYYRSDFAELLASALFPLLFLGALRVVRDRSEQRWRGVPLLAIAFAAIWLSNAPAAVIATYATVLALSAGCIEKRSFRPLVPGGAAMALGFGLASFYIFPAYFEQRWVQIAQAVEGNLHLRQNFLFTQSTDPEFALFNWKVSTVALAVMLVAGIAGVFSARRLRDYPAMWWMMAAVALASAFMMFPASIWFWRYLPELPFLQFPWRWLVPLSVAYALFLASAIGTSRRRWPWYAFLVLALASVAVTIVRDAWWEGADVQVLEAAIRSGHGYEGTDEYCPLGCDRSELPGANLDPDMAAIVNETPPTPLVAVYDPVSGNVIPLDGTRVLVDKWSEEDRVFSVDSATPATIALRLLDYPAWQVRIDGEISKAESQPGTVRMLVRVPAGLHRIEVKFRRTWDRAAGAATSCLSALLLLGCIALARRRAVSP